ncbi:tRNA-dihydrouridine(16/17) synthase [NAD(P)(+)]-like protein, partial [Tanacetum coccineum]
AEQGKAAILEVEDLSYKKQTGEPLCMYRIIEGGIKTIVNLFARLNVKLIITHVKKMVAKENTARESGWDLEPARHTTIMHRRTRDEKDRKKIRANWDAIRAVKSALKILVLANGNIRRMEATLLQNSGYDRVHF